MITGKTTYVWDIPSIFGGDVTRIAACLREAGFEGAILHNSYLSSWSTPARANLIKALRAEGIEPIGGAAVYGGNPTLEGQQAAALCNSYGLSAFVFDAESTFDGQEASDSNAVKLLQSFRKVTTAQSGWCWWARWKSPVNGNQWHPKSVLWAAMAENYGDADFGLPMAYWEGESAASAVTIVEQCVKQWREVTNKPLIPIGRAYVGDGGTARPDAVTAFDKRARELGAVGISWWSMQHALAIPGVWDALAKTAKFTAAPVTPPAEPNADLYAEVGRLRAEVDRLTAWARSFGEK